MKLIALSGTPVSGKSSIAHALSEQLHIPALTLSQQNQDYQQLIQQAAQSLARGQSVILDSPALPGWFQGACRELAYTYYIPLYVITCCYRDANIQRYRMRVRQRGYPDWIEQGYETARHFASSFSVWDATGLILEADSGLDTNIARALAFVAQYDG